MSEGRRPGACLALHRDALDPGPKEARRDEMDNVALLTVRQQDVPRPAPLLRGVSLRALPVLPQVGVERRDAAQMRRERRQVAQQ